MNLQTSIDTCIVALEENGSIFISTSWRFIKLQGWSGLKATFLHDWAFFQRCFVPKFLHSGAINSSSVLEESSGFGKNVSISGTSFAGCIPKRGLWRRVFWKSTNDFDFSLHKQLPFFCQGYKKSSLKCISRIVGQLTQIKWASYKHLWRKRLCSQVYLSTLNGRRFFLAFSRLKRSEKVSPKNKRGLKWKDQKVPNKNFQTFPKAAAPIFHHVQ